MNKLNTRRIDRFITRYKQEQQVSFAVAEERLMREFQRRVARKEASKPPKPPAAPNEQEKPILEKPAFGTCYKCGKTYSTRLRYLKLEGDKYRCAASCRVIPQANSFGIALAESL